MKIDARRSTQIRQALEKGLESGRLREHLDAVMGNGATEAEVRQVLAELGDRFAKDQRGSVERLLAQQSFRGESTASGVTVTGGSRVHDLRAKKQNPWWTAVKAEALPAPSFPEPPRDVEVHGERFTKDDVLTLLRGVARAS